MSGLPSPAVLVTPADPMALAGSAADARAPSNGQRQELLSVMALVVPWAALWLLWLALSACSPPFDNVEQLTWVRSLQWGYYKHPPLPTFLIAPWVALFGLHAEVSYGLGAAITIASLLVAWQVVRELGGARFAWLALLGTLCVTYYNDRLHYYNHNIVLLLCVCIAAWGCRRALARPSLGAWAVVGLALGAGALSKYQVGIAGVSVLACWVGERGWRHPVHRRGLVLAVGLALLLFLPHAAWLVRSGFLPVHYALESSLGVRLEGGEHLANVLMWIADQVNRLSPALVLMGLLAWVGGGRQQGAAAARRADADIDADPATRWFLFCWGGLPLLLIALVGLVCGAELQRQWGTAFMAFTVPWLMGELRGVRWRAVDPRRALWLFAAVQVIVMAADWATSPMGPQATMRHHNRNFASVEIAQALAQDAHQHLPGQLCVLAGPAGITSVLALRLPERPLVMVDGRREFSPWVPDTLPAGCATAWVATHPAGLPAGLPAPHTLPGGLVWSAAGLAPAPAPATALRPPSSPPA